MDLSCDYLKMKHPIAQKALYAAAGSQGFGPSFGYGISRETTL